MSSKDHIRQVLKTPLLNGKGETFCGKQVTKYDMPVTLDIAILFIINGTWQQPCKHCMREVKKIIDSQE